MEKKTKKILRRAKQVHATAAVTVLLNTHRTRPDNQKDPIRLKDLLKQASARITTEHGSKVAEAIMGKLNAMAEKIDHAHNKESLVLFASADFADHVKLPISVTERVVVGDTFATRDLLRALHQQAEYYVLWLNRKQARLFQAANGKVEEEVAATFPIANNVATTDAAKQVADRDHAVLVEEYFNRVDKALVPVINENPLPVVLATESRNADHFRRVADKKEFIHAAFSPSREDLTPLHLVEEAWNAYRPEVKAAYNSQLNALGKAISAGQLLNDHNDIWRSVNEGRGETLFVKQGHFQPATLNDGRIELLHQADRVKKGAVDDIIDEMIEQNVAKGGSVMFVNGDELDRFNGLALATRY